LAAWCNFLVPCHALNIYAHVAVSKQQGAMATPCGRCRLDRHMCRAPALQQFFVQPPTYLHFAPQGTGLVAAGGVIYTVGGTIYAFRWPNPSPKYFGYHEIFHAATLLASICHFAAVNILA
jgi:Haemolysin-III related